MQASILGRFRPLPQMFIFNDEPSVVVSDPNNPDPAATATPLPTPPALPEPKLPDDIIKELKDKQPKVYDIIFGRGVKKGETSQKRLPLSDEELEAAQLLFSKAKPADVASLLEAKGLAQQAAIDKAKAEKNFTQYAEQLEERHKSAMAQIEAAYQKKIELIEKEAGDRERLIAQLKMSLSDLKINKELLAVAKIKHVIDPSDVVVHLAPQLQLNDLFEITMKGGASDQPVNLSDLIDNLIHEKPHLVSSVQTPGTGTPKPGSSALPVQPVTVFKRSQLRDPVFYKAHEKEILAASRANRIVDDITKRI